ncbi:50S ribosomal protein L6 [Patescibacteria group bacterium]|nr:MAG: 50S ribosomal protein L6 [Patescibacteria group bacterium]
MPAKTEVTLSGSVLTVKGPLATLTKNFNTDIAIKIDGSTLSLLPVRTSNALNALWGTYVSHIENMLSGVNTPFVKKLVVEGIGFKSDVKGTNLALALGFSHPVTVAIPADLKVTADKNIITVSGSDIESVGRFVSHVRSQRKPEPYKGKGIRYDTEVIRRKQGKKSA